MREGKEEDSELCPGTLQHYEKKDAAKENKKREDGKENNQESGVKKSVKQSISRRFTTSNSAC